MNHLKTHQTNPTTAQYRPVQSNTSTAQYSQVQPIPEPDLKPELFGQTRPEVKKPYSLGPGKDPITLPLNLKPVRVASHGDGYEEDEGKWDGFHDCEKHTAPVQGTR